MKWSSQLTGGSYVASGLVHVAALVAAHSLWTAAPRAWPARSGVQAVAVRASDAAQMIEIDLPEVTEFPEEIAVEPLRTADGLPELHPALEPSSEAAVRSPSSSPVREKASAPEVPHSLANSPPPIPRSRTQPPDDFSPAPPVTRRLDETPSRHPPSPPSMAASVSLESEFSAGEWRKSLPQPLYNPEPRYPAELLAVGRSGVVMVRIQIRADGTVERCAVYRTSGEHLFDDAALRAVAGWRFEPAVRFGTAVPTEILYPIRFQFLAEP